MHQGTAIHGQRVLGGHVPKGGCRIAHPHAGRAHRDRCSGRFFAWPACRVLAAATKWYAVQHSHAPWLLSSHLQLTWPVLGVPGLISGGGRQLTEAPVMRWNTETMVGVFDRSAVVEFEVLDEHGNALWWVLRTMPHVCACRGFLTQRSAPPRSGRRHSANPL